jgi:hypothetical protein
VTDRMICGNCGQWQDSPDLRACERIEYGPGNSASPSGAYPVPATHEWITEAESRMPEPSIEDYDNDCWDTDDAWPDMPVVVIDVAELADAAAQKDKTPTVL